VPALRRKFTRVVAERHDNIGPTEELLLVSDDMAGELFCILESDDYYLPTKLEENVRFLVEHPEMGLVHSDVDCVHADGIEHAHWRSTRRRIPTGDVFEDLLLDNFVMTCTFCCRTELYRAHVDQADHIRRGYVARDWAIWLDLARHAPFGYIDQPLARYRLARGSWSRPANAERRFAWLLSMKAMRLDYAEEFPPSSPVAEQVAYDYHRFLFRHGLVFERRAQFLESYSWLREHYPARYGSRPHRMAARLVGVPSLWRMGTRLGVPALLRRVWSGLIVRRDRRAARAALSASGGPE